MKKTRELSIILMSFIVLTGILAPVNAENVYLCEGSVIKWSCSHIVKNAVADYTQSYYELFEVNYVATTSDEIKGRLNENGVLKDNGADVFLHNVSVPSDWMMNGFLSSASDNIYFIQSPSGVSDLKTELQTFASNNGYTWLVSGDDWILSKSGEEGAGTYTYNATIKYTKDAILYYITEIYEYTDDAGTSREEYRWTRSQLTLGHECANSGAYSTSGSGDSGLSATGPNLIGTPVVLIAGLCFLAFIKYRKRQLGL